MEWMRSGGRRDAGRGKTNHFCPVERPNQPRCSNKLQKYTNREKKKTITKNKEVGGYPKRGEGQGAFVQGPGGRRICPETGFKDTKKQKTPQENPLMHDKEKI